ncbi:MAG: BACON domain-containing protein [Gemmatimonadota bacterium]
MSLLVSRVLIAALFAIVCATSCTGPSSPVGPGAEVPDPSPPGPAPPGGPEVTISANALSLGAVAAEASVALRNLGTGPVSWTHQTTAAWIAASPGAGTLAGGTSVPVRIVVTRAGLEPGVHAGRVRFVVSDETLDVDVTLEVPPPAMPMAEVSPASLALGVDDGSASIYVTNAGGASLSWSWNGPAWAETEPSSGTTAPGSTTQVTLTPDRADLPDGTHTATLTLDSDGGTRTVGLSVTVASPARLAVSPTQVDFGVSGTSAGVTIANDGGRPLAWTAGDDAIWLTASPTSGTVGPHSSASLQLFAERDGLTPGTYVETLSIESVAGPASVAVVMTVSAPSPPPPPPPPPPPSGSVALAGRVVDQFDGHGMAGVTVQFAGETVTTDASGGFAVPGTSSGSLRDLALSGPNVHPRLTFARGSDSQWRIVPAGFDMDAYDDLAREYEPRTIRWTASPNIYVDTRPDEFEGGLELDRWIAEVQGDAAAFVSNWTGGMVDAGSVTVGSSPPPDGTPGTIVIHFSEDASIYGASSTVGLARTFWSGDRSISAAVVWLRFVRFSGPSHAGTRRAVLGHELGHALGMGHMNGSTSSIMTPSVSSSSLTAFDDKAGLLLYTRSPGNTAPDTDSAATYSGSLVPSSAVELYEWVCGATEHR